MPEGQRSGNVCEECGEPIDPEVLICPHCGDRGRLRRQLAQEWDAEDPEERAYYDRLVRESRGRVSLFTYAGAAMIVLSGLLEALRLDDIINHRDYPTFVVYVWPVLVMGIALIIVGLARQAQRMCK